MKKIEIICVGKLKEKFLTAAYSEYNKRLSSYCKLTSIELADEKIAVHASSKEEEIFKDREGDRILAKITNNAFVIALAIEGQIMTSPEFAAYLDEIYLRGANHVVFVVGGSVGLSSKVLARANLKLSFSKMTFPHQLFRIMLIEQIYRAFKISANEVYHK
ncbi:23S rRNA (pseudouridine(1915)-N(3))-methyltransferase RlmH [Candidatus Epulonipiscium viviparus]|uniref:23S rRNA (pseudouridine(1915)-N(3))-methyltransferase RlmH n=1 Tax=Candidatus Epulonipiscium viviparus TaxID=420336 RepID=UPI00016C0A28|nr:23S rRNA (pseudouridine(1915)-N(3))-methyltransferase RlmH [Candidatus Epulopiscium viviparus]